MADYNKENYDKMVAELRRKSGHASSRLSDHNRRVFVNHFRE